MTPKQIAGLGRQLGIFLALFSDCFHGVKGRALLAIYVKGLLSDLHRKTAETIGLSFGKAPRTLQRFLESIKWVEEKLRDRCQQMVAREHSHTEAIGCIDESGIGKSGSETVGVGRQYNGNRGKVDNCVVGVHLSYSAPGFQCLLDSCLYLPKDWADDPQRRKKLTFPMKSSSAPNHKSRWISSTERWPTESRCRAGRSTNCMAATVRFSTAWKRVGRCSWAKFPAISESGCKSLASCVAPRKTRANADAARSIRGGRVGLVPAKSATC